LESMNARATRPAKPSDSATFPVGSVLAFTLSS
jgi:hypothetical protein